MSESLQVLARIVSKRLEREDVTFIAGDVIQPTQAWQIASRDDLRAYAESLAAEIARLERQVDEYHEWVEEALKALPDWMHPVGHDEVHAALATPESNRTKGSE